MKLTNQEIYNYALALNNAFQDSSQKLPIKVNFYLQKNKNTLIQLVFVQNISKEIEQERMNIICAYGHPAEDENQYIIPQDKVDETQRELNDLLALEQDVVIYTIDINGLSDELALTTGQMEAMMFMFD